MVRKSSLIAGIAALLFIAASGCDDESSEASEGGDGLESFVGDRPTLPGPFAGQTLPIDVEQFLADHPEHAEGRVDDVDRGLRYHYQDGEPGVVLYGGEHQGKINSVDLRVVRASPQEDLTSRLQATWGSPERSWSTSSGEHRCWFDEQAGVRATYSVIEPDEREDGEEDFHVVRFSRAVTWDAVIREYRGDAGLGDRPLIGSTLEQARAIVTSFPRRQLLDSGRVSPSIDVGCHDSFGPTLNIVDGRVVGFQGSIGFTGEDDGEERMRAHLERFEFLGEPRQEWNPERGENAKLYASDPPITIVWMGPLRLKFEVGQVATPTTPPGDDEDAEDG